MFRLALLMVVSGIGIQALGQIVFTIEHGNRILDSLESRAEWERSYRVLYTQYLLAKEHGQDLDSTFVTANSHCDSLVKNGYARERELITENTSLTQQVQEAKDSGRAAKVERWGWRIAAAAALTLAILSR